MLRTPGVYVAEPNAFPGVSLEVSTAVPAFIGYTSKAERQGLSLRMRPHRIASLAEFERVFGPAPTPRFTLQPLPNSQPLTSAHVVVDGVGYHVSQSSRAYRLYHGICHFFANGGGPCVIVSVGDFDTPIAESALRAGIAALANESEPTLLVVPDAVSLSEADCLTVQRAMLTHCASTTPCHRFAILDLWGGHRLLGGTDDPVARFRQEMDTVPPEVRRFGAAYYPWLRTNIVQSGDLDLACLDPASRAIVGDGPEATTVLTEARTQLNMQPASAGVAGVYAATDAERGVWKAPANVALSGVIAPLAPVTSDQQQSLNITPDGTSVNAIRMFVSQGVLVWGARTLDGNSQDWCYISVRRTANMIEQRTRAALATFADRPNTAATWASVVSMLSITFTSLWATGALAGASVDEAFAVDCGVPSTMTPDDVRTGVVRVRVRVALTRPAEFLTFTFEQAMRLA